MASWTSAIAGYDIGPVQLVLYMDFDCRAKIEVGGSNGFWGLKSIFAQHRTAFKLLKMVRLHSPWCISANFTLQHLIVNRVAMSAVSIEERLAQMDNEEKTSSVSNRYYISRLRYYSGYFCCTFFDVCFFGGIFIIIIFIFCWQLQASLRKGEPPR